MSKTTAYYYSRLSKEEQAAYHAIKSGLTVLAPSFAVPRLEGRRLGELFFQLRLDCPEIFYASGFHYRFYADAGHVEFIPEYLFDKGKIREHQKALTARAAKLVRPAQKLSEREKEQYIHDFICENVRYDKLKKPYSHEIIGPLGHGVGVCEGIAKTVKILCDALGLWSVIAVSEANLQKKIRYRHAWNVVRLEGKYYHVDATFDNSLSRGGPLRGDYLNLDDKHVFRDHEPVIWPVPACGDGGRFYYREQKLSFTRQEEVAKRALQAIRKKRPFVFHWRGGYLTREMLTELFDLLEETARQKGRHAHVRLNWPQAVLRVDFLEEAPEENWVAQQANEGEDGSAWQEPAEEAGRQDDPEGRSGRSEEAPEEEDT